MILPKSALNITLIFISLVSDLKFSEDSEVGPNTKECLAIPIKHVLLPKVNVPCKFPFTYQGKEYHKCIKKDHDQYWCALDMNHFTGLNGLNLFCPKCWKNETYRWGNCLSGKSCGSG